ncbi:MAG TPA: FAD-binding protein [Alphaproteobacteria bacterium]|nr:FAD-binding protein [Alphaproteobacteria bacterium]
MAVLVVAEHDGAALAPATLSTITCAKAIADADAGDVTVLVAGSGCRPVAEEGAAVEGVAKVLLSDDGAYEHASAEALAALVKPLAGDYGHILYPASTFGKNAAPRLAALLDSQQVSDIQEVVDAETFVRPNYAGNALATVRSSDSIKVITVRATAFEKAASGGEAAPIEDLAPAGDDGLSSFVGAELSAPERPELTSAGVIISGGRGMQSGENFKLLEEIADLLNAAVGASRAAVDSGFVPNDFQVGQTGKIVAPELYIAVGISGAIQHLAGMKDSKVIVAINKDEEAPIFQVADYGIVGDLFQVLPELKAALEDAKKG